MKAMTKRLLSMLVVLAMVLSMVPVVGLPAITASALTVTPTTSDITNDANNMDFSDPTSPDFPTSCPACGQAGITWKPLTAGLGSVSTIGEYHYYLSGDRTITEGEYIFRATAGTGTDYSTFCLHLNGMTLTTAKNIYGGNYARMQILGDGVVNYTGTGSFMDIYSAQMRVYGGTYNTTSTGEAMHLRRNLFSAVLGNATFNGPVVIGDGANASQVSLLHNATFKNLTVGTSSAASKLTFDSTWYGAVYSLTQTNATLSVPTAISNGAVFSDAGEKLKRSSSTALAVDENYSKDTFAPAANGGWAWCEVCNNHAKWTALESALGTAVPDTHYYLASELTDETATYIMQTSANVWGLNGHDTVCLNLNGKTLNTAKGFSVGNTSILNVIANGGTINYTGTGTTAGTDCMFRVYTAKLYLYGGTYNTVGADIIYNSSTSPSYHTYIYDADINGSVVVTNINKHYIYGTTSITDFHQNSTSGYVEFGTGWSGTIDKATFAAMTTDQNPNYVPAANAVVKDGAASEGKIYLENGNLLAYDTTNGYLYEVVPAVQEEVFNQEDLATFGQAWCEHCKKFIAANEWHVLEDGFGGATAYGEAVTGHYYVANSFTNTKANDFLQSTNDYPTKACIQLNGKTITTSVPIEMGGGGAAYVNIMDVGNGGIIYEGSGQLFLGYSGNTRLYGGTYTTDAGVLAVKSSGTGGIFLLGDTTFVNGGVAMNNTGVLYLQTSGNVPSATIGASSQVKIYESFTGRVDSITFAAGVGEDKLIPETSATIEGDLKGSITMFDGRALTQEGTQLKANDYAFDPDGHNGYSYCPVCKEYVTWTDCKGVIGTVTDTMKHVYLTEDVTHSTNETFINVSAGTTHFNTNGMSITPVWEGDVRPLGVYATSSGKIDLFNTSEKESYISGHNTAGFGAALQLGGNNAVATLHDGVTLKFVTGNTKAPVAINQGTFVMKGGKVDASGSSVAGVQVRNQSSGTAAFVMDGGTLVAGTGAAVQVGQSSTANQVNSVTLNGGTVTGKITVNSGSVTLDKEASPSGVITVTATAS